MGVAALLIGLLLAAFVALSFNKLVRGRNGLREAWSGIDVQLKRRRDLVPNLVETVKAYTAHETHLLTEITNHRPAATTARSPKETSDSESVLSQDFSRVFALAEAYPDIKADSAFRELGANLVEIEDHLQYARRYYNGSSRDLNNLIESFPTNLIAGLFGLKTADFFELANASESLAPDLKNTFTSAKD